MKSQSAVRYLNFDPVARDYDGSRFLPPEIQEQAALLLKSVARLKPGQRLLDAGAGTGRFAFPLAKVGMPVIGVDISEQMIAQLLQKRREWERNKDPIPLRVLRGDLRRLPLASGSCHAAVVVHILHLIQEWQEVLCEIRRVLTTSGTLILAQESGRRIPTREFYFEQARQRNALQSPLGAGSAAQVREWLASTGAVVEQVDQGGVQWQQRWRVADTLEMLRRRTWSHLWHIPDQDHQAIMEAVVAWAWQTYGTLEIVEEAEATLSVWTVRWDSEPGPHPPVVMRR